MKSKTVKSKKEKNAKEVKTVKKHSSILRKSAIAPVDVVVVRAKAKNVLSSPQKARLVADLVRGKAIQDAIDILLFTRKKAASIILKVLKSAVANAENNHNLDSKSLYIARILIDDGIKLPRYRFASRGRVVKILKRRAHILIELRQNK
ncbi:MAG: 50S ribosomal protein L22 [Patescibacteria group bacterium]|nr:50S ribosomal protein L22 [Patescibacteria group bacterium]